MVCIIYYDVIQASTGIQEFLNYKLQIRDLCPGGNDELIIQTINDYIVGQIYI